MNFLGSVNIFHGRVENGKAVLGSLTVDYPDHPAGPRPAAGYARPHELGVTRSEEDGGGLWATLESVSSAGAIMRLELADAEKQVLQVELARDRYDALAPRIGERLYVRPNKLRVFLVA